MSELSEYYNSKEEYILSEVRIRASFLRIG